jgi:hypothetical protein
MSKPRPLCTTSSGSGWDELVPALVYQTAMTADNTDLMAAKQLLDGAKHGGFRFARVAPGPDGPLRRRETLEWRDTIYLAGFGQIYLAGFGQHAPPPEPASSP